MSQMPLTIAIRLTDIFKIVPIKYKIGIVWNCSLFAGFLFLWWRRDVTI